MRERVIRATDADVQAMWDNGGAVEIIAGAVIGDVRSGGVLNIDLLRACQAAHEQSVPSYLIVFFLGDPGIKALNDAGIPWASRLTDGAYRVADLRVAGDDTVEEVKIQKMGKDGGGASVWLKTDVIGDRAELWQVFCVTNRMRDAVLENLEEDDDASLWDGFFKGTP